jgi:hypothetical protein
MLGSTASGLLSGEDGEYAAQPSPESGGGTPSRASSRAHSGASKPPRRDFGADGGDGDRDDAPSARAHASGSGGGGGSGGAAGASGSGAGRRNWYNARGAARRSDADPDETSFRSTKQQQQQQQQQRPLDPLDADEYYARLKTQEEGEWGSGDEDEGEDEEGYEEDDYTHDARLAAETRRTMAAQKRGGRGGGRGGGSDGEGGDDGSESDDNAAAPVLDKDILQRVRTRARCRRTPMP